MPEISPTLRAYVEPVRNFDKAIFLYHFVGWLPIIIHHQKSALIKQVKELLKPARPNSVMKLSCIVLSLLFSSATAQLELQMMGKSHLRVLDGLVVDSRLSL
jgi:hypothetical protein